MCVHCFMDGRDVPPTSGITYIEEIKDYIKQLGCGRIGVVSGRYYAMDRDKRWDRVKLAYDALTLGRCPHVSDAAEGCQSSYANGETDEFIKPFICCQEGSESDVTIKDGDAVIFCNFRPDAVPARLPVHWLTIVLMVLNEKKRRKIWFMSA